MSRPTRRGWHRKAVLVRSSSAAAHRRAMPDGEGASAGCWPCTCALQSPPTGRHWGKASRVPGFEQRAAHPLHHQRQLVAAAAPGQQVVSVSAGCTSSRSVDRALAALRPAVQAGQRSGPGQLHRAPGACASGGRGRNRRPWNSAARITRTRSRELLTTPPARPGGIAGSAAGPGASGHPPSRSGTVAIGLPWRASCQ